jgi:hypothetical protein
MIIRDGVEVRVIVTTGAVGIIGKASTRLSPSSPTLSVGNSDLMSASRELRNMLEYLSNVAAST